MNEQKKPPADRWICVAHPRPLLEQGDPDRWSKEVQANRISCYKGSHHIGMALPRAITEKHLAKIAEEVARVLNATNADGTSLPEIRGFDLLHFGTGARG